MAVLKGQNLRVFVGGKCVAAATSCTLNVSAQTEDASTKDSTGDWAVSEAVGKSWDVSVDALVVLTDPESSSGKSTVDLLSLIGTTVAIVFDTTTGANNRTANNSTIKKSGNAILTSISISAANRQKGTCSASFQGTGALS